MAFQSCKRFAAAALAALTCIAAASAQSITPLGFLPEGGFSHAFGLSEDGAFVVGTAGNRDFNERAVRWKAGVIRHFGTLGGDYSEGSDISFNGQVVVGQAYNSNRRGRAFRWTRETGMQDLGAFGLGQFSYATGVSRLGDVVVGWAQDSSADLRAFRWTSGTGLVDLGDLGGGRSVATDVSANGSVVVGTSRNASSSTRAFLWHAATGMVDLGTLGGASATAEGVSPDGSVVVGYSSTETFSAPCKWTNGTATALKVLNPDGEAMALAASTHGKVIVGTAQNDQFRSRAVMWIGNQIYSLSRVYASLLPAKWTLELAEGISPDGRFIVGYARDEQGRRQAYLLDRGPDASPEATGETVP